MTEQTEGAEVEALATVVRAHLHCGHDGGRSGRDGSGEQYTWTCGMVADAYREMGWEASHLADALLASDWLAAREAAAEVRGAQAVLAAVRDGAPSLNMELRHDGTFDPQAAAYVEGFKAAYGTARAAAAAAGGGAS